MNNSVYLKVVLVEMAAYMCVPAMELKLDTSFVLAPRQIARVSVAFPPNMDVVKM